MFYFSAKSLIESKAENQDPNSQSLWAASFPPTPASYLKALKVQIGLKKNDLDLSSTLPFDNVGDDTGKHLKAFWKLQGHCKEERGKHRGLR